MTHPVVIAIDGPSASGKSSTAASVARALGMSHIDSGSLYRALTWLAIEHDLRDEMAITAAADEAQIRLVARGKDLGVVAGRDETDIEHAIRTPPVTARVSAVSAMPGVRDWVNERLRSAAIAAGGVVLDGRDIGTAVFPDAQLKVFLTATPHARAERRLRQRGVPAGEGEVRHEADLLADRDRQDTARPVAPLRQAPDAIEVDTTALSFDAQVARIVALAHERGLPRR